MVGRKSPLFPNLLDKRIAQSMKQIDEKSSIYISRGEMDPSSLHNESSRLQITAADTMQIGLLLSQQEKEFGTNMYDCLTAEDEEELLEMMNAGMSSHEAALQLFQRKFSYKINVNEESTNNNTMPHTEADPSSAATDLKTLRVREMKLNIM